MKFTKTETLHFVTSKAGNGHSTGTLQELEMEAIKHGHVLTFRSSRLNQDVCFVQVNGYEVAKGFRSLVDSFEFFQELNAA
jgi:hypothetical protein